MTATEHLKRSEESAKRHFANFKPEFKKFDDFEVLDWRDADGGNNYYVRYVFDTKACKLYVSGDLGYGIFALTWNPTLENTVKHAPYYDYMLEKLSLGCSSDLYEYCEEVAREELIDQFKNDPERFGDATKHAFDADTTPERAAQIILEAYDVRIGIDSAVLNMTHGGDAQQFIEEFDIDYWEWIGSIGRVIHPRVVAWLIGLRMAWDIIKQREPAQS